MPERRGTSRTAVSLPCTLHRRHGSAIAATTVDLGPGGMCVSCARPLATDEVLRFDLSLTGGPVDGQARVLRQQGYGVYALRFERLVDGCRERLEGMFASTS